MNAIPICCSGCSQTYSLSEWERLPFGHPAGGPYGIHSNGKYSDGGYVMNRKCPCGTIIQCDFPHSAGQAGPKAR